MSKIMLETMELKMLGIPVNGNEVERESLRRKSEGIQGICDFTEGLVSYQEATELVDDLGPRHEFNEGLSPYPASIIYNILSNVYTKDSPRKPVQNFIKNTPIQRRMQLIEYLSRSVQSHKIFSQNFRDNEVKLDDSITAKLVYGLTDWEGVSGVAIWLKDEHSNGFVPTYILRGNPFLSSNGIEFHIRNVQTWVSEIAPSISQIRDDEELIRERPELIDVIRERQRLVDRMLRRFDLDVDKTKEFSYSNTAFIMVLAFMQAQGVKVFRGIEHSKHPQVIKKKPLPANYYNDLFKHWFGSIDQSDNVHPWILDARGSKFYLPHWNYLPVGIRSLIMTVYNKSVHN